jgi:hypothetical protein
MSVILRKLPEPTTSAHDDPNDDQQENKNNRSLARATLASKNGAGHGRSISVVTMLSVMEI